jgi:hypothetical protein
VKYVLPELISQEIISGGTFFTGTYFGSHIHISGFHSITSVSLDKLYQGSRNFSEQKFRFPWHNMKFTINWLFCPYRSNQHRSWTVFHSHLLYWWTVILSNWKNEENTHNTTKNKVHIVYFFKLVFWPVVRVFP